MLQYEVVNNKRQKKPIVHLKHIHNISILFIHRHLKGNLVVTLERIHQETPKIKQFLKTSIMDVT